MLAHADLVDRAHLLRRLLRAALASDSTLSHSMRGLLVVICATLDDALHSAPPVAAALRSACMQAETALVVWRERASGGANP